MKKIYEEHNLDSQKLPIIFHYNTVTPNRPGIVNWHDNIEMLYCIEGKGQILCNSVNHTVKKGDLFIVNSNMLHHCTAREGCFELACLIVDLDFLVANEIHAEELEFDSIVSSEVVEELYEKVVEEISAQKEFQVAGIRTRVLDLMLYLARKHSRPASEDANVEKDNNVKLALGYIKANFQHKITLEGVADEVGLSKFYFARTFKEATGMTLISYVNTIRCRNAKKLLATDKYTIHEVASMCGFENDSYFSKTYRNIMGCLPSESVR